MFFVKNSLLTASLLLVAVVAVPSVIGESKKYPPLAFTSTEVIPVAASSSSTAEPLSPVVQPSTSIKGKYISDIYIYTYTHTHTYIYLY